MSSTALLLTHLRGLIHTFPDDMPPLLDGYVEKQALLESVNSTCSKTYNMNILVRYLAPYTSRICNGAVAHTKDKFIYLKTYEQFDAVLCAAGVRVAEVSRKPSFTGLSKSIIALIQEKKKISNELLAVKDKELSSLKSSLDSLTKQSELESVKRESNTTKRLNVLLQRQLDVESFCCVTHRAPPAD